MQSITRELIGIIASIILSVLGTSNNEIVIPKYNVNKEQEIMTIVIDKIIVNNKIYSKNSKLNDIDKNVIILKESDYPDKENGTVLIGGHSGTGPLAYFARLGELELGDIVKIFYEDNEYDYRVDNISKDNKDGKIRIDYSIKKNRLIIYTCHPDDKDNFLVISLIR